MHASLETGWTYYLLGIAAFLLIGGGIYIFLFRGSRSRTLKSSAQFSGYGSRLGLIEDCPLGYDQKLILVRRDHIEHLLFVSPETIFLVETAISPPNDATQEGMTQRWQQNEMLRSQSDLFTPPTSASVFSFPEHKQNLSHLKEPPNFPTPSAHKDQNSWIAAQDLYSLHPHLSASEKERKGAPPSFTSLKHPHETPSFDSSPWEITPQESFLNKPLEKELEKVHGKVEKLTSELTSFSSPQNGHPDFSTPRIPPHENAHDHFFPQPHDASPREENPKEFSSPSQIASPFGSTPLYKSESLHTQHQINSGTPEAPQSSLFMSPPPRENSENENITHGNTSIFNAVSRSAESSALSDLSTSERHSREKAFIEQAAPELPTQSKSGVSLQEIEKEFARLLGNRPPT